MAELLFSELCDVEVNGGVSGPRSRYKLARVRCGCWMEGRDITGRTTLPLCFPSPSDSEVGVGENLLLLVAGGVSEGT